MSFTIKSFSRWCARRAAQLVGAGGAVAIAAGVFLPGSRAVAADNIILTYGIFNETISVESLRTLVETGETTPTLDFLFDLMNITPEAAAIALRQDVQVSVRFVDDVLYSLPGEFALFQMGQIFHNRGKVASIQALRSAFTLSASEDSNLTLLEFFENYPNSDLYVDGALLLDVASEAAEFIEKTGRSLAVPIAIIKDLLNSVVCDCGTQSFNFSEETDPFAVR
ncbi:MAG TPA: alpha/beta hydrolase [Oscillatoriales cyanobacterium M59_W2019_021]|nr:MAG: alpha/beta hydrolase [Cyanobacteria bacterium J055]HIK33092.1 alpha/beta hydrolase [Oscillatoriales cyanobacterium M4454_W2019_049]HIK49454.1 alpha/beta hydrolase [Oscillatoriales cyanobacterium M59_W2019_021]